MLQVLEGLDVTSLYLGVLLVALLVIIAGIIILRLKVSEEEKRKRDEQLRGWYKYTLFLCKRIQRTLHENPTTPDESGARNEVQRRMSSTADELEQHRANRPRGVPKNGVSLIDQIIKECRELEVMPTEGTSYTFDVTGETIDTGDEVKKEFVEKARSIARVAEELEKHSEARIREYTPKEER